jgi:hypothetical protein
VINGKAAELLGIEMSLTPFATADEVVDQARHGRGVVPQREPSGLPSTSYDPTRRWRGRGNPARGPTKKLGM